MGTFRNELLIVKAYILKIASVVGRLITLPVQKGAAAVVVFVSISHYMRMKCERAIKRSSVELR